MGGGAWTATAATNFVSNKYATYSVSSLSNFATLDTMQIYDSRKMDPDLDPHGVIRECVDSEEHPNTFPIILALDVTGSMGKAASMCATQLNDIMEKLYGQVQDVEFMMMGIGDLSYDRAPIQVTQFESDVRILDQATKIWFEAGGGGNAFESYTAAWYFGLYRTKLDCWKHGQKGLIITLGDEPLNPYLPGHSLGDKLGVNTQDIETESLYKEALEKFNIYHIAITDKECSFASYKERIENSWQKLLGERCLYAKSEELPEVISHIVEDSQNGTRFVTQSKEGISW